MNEIMVPCDYCNAKPGERCKIGRNLKADFHTARVELTKKYTSISEWWDSLPSGVYPSVHARIAYEDHTKSYIGQKLFHRIMRELFGREWLKGTWVYRKNTPAG